MKNPRYDTHVAVFFEENGEIYVRCGGRIPETGLFIPVRITEAGDYDLKGEML